MSNIIILMECLIDLTFSYNATPVSDAQGYAYNYIHMMEHQVRHLEVMGYVGIDNLPNRLISKYKKEGFLFNIMCIGEPGMGKTTLMNSLFKTNFEINEKSQRLLENRLDINSYELHESDVRLKLTICETVGYGDEMDKAESPNAITEYIDAQFENYLQEELKLKYSISPYQDTRVHICLYFISPHHLKSIDIFCMKLLYKRVNLIPLIAKADTITKNELKTFKSEIRSQLEANEIEIYKCPEDDESETEVNKEMNSLVPLAVIGSSNFVNVGDENVRARQYPWGIVEVENEFHCDFIKLQELIIKVNLEDMREKTHQIHYELYRKRQLQIMGFNDIESYQQMLGSKISKHIQEIQDTEDDMQQRFCLKIKDMEEKFTMMNKHVLSNFGQSSEEYNHRRAWIERMRKNLENDEVEFNKCKLSYRRADSLQCIAKRTLKK